MASGLQTSRPSHRFLGRDPTLQVQLSVDDVCNAFQRLLMPYNSHTIDAPVLCRLLVTINLRHVALVRHLPAIARGSASCILPADDSACGMYVCMAAAHHVALA